MQSVGRFCRHSLEALGFHLWVDTSELRGGTAWREDIDFAVSSAGAVLVLKSPASDESIYVVYEWALALGLGQQVLPINYGSTSAHPRLRALHHLDYREDDDTFWDELRTDLEEIFDPHLPIIRRHISCLTSPLARERLLALENLVSIAHPAAAAAIENHFLSCSDSQALETADALASTNSQLVVDSLYARMLDADPSAQNKIAAVLAKFDCSSKCVDMVETIAKRKDGRLLSLFSEILAGSRTKANAILRAIPDDGDKEKAVLIAKFLWGIAGASAVRKYSQIADGNREA